MVGQDPAPRILGGAPGSRLLGAVSMCPAAAPALCTPQQLRTCSLYRKDSTLK